MSTQPVDRRRPSFHMIGASAATCLVLLACAAGASAGVQHFNIEPDQVVANGVPEPGAGNIESPGSVDIYHFTASPGQDVFFNEVFASNCLLTWTLTDANETTIFSQPFGQCGVDPGVLTLGGGAYTLTVQFPDDLTGTYSFVLNTDASTDTIELELNQLVSDGVPARGAGNIEWPGSSDVYTFTADPGTTVFFNEIFTTNCSLVWTLTDEDDAVIFSQAFGQCGADPGSFVLGGGTYTLRVADPAGNVTATYSFNLVTPDTWDHFDLQLDQVVSDGLPAPGAGNVESYGAVDVYTVADVPAGTQVFFNEVLTSNCAITWTVRDEEENVLFSQQLGQCGADPGTFILDGGTYTIHVQDPTGNGQGTYAFVLVTPASYELFELEYGVPVSNGFPAPGAGNLETPGAVDIYTFNAVEGDVVYFNEISSQGCSFVWKVTGPDDSLLFSQTMGVCGPDPGEFVLEEGEYTIRVEEPSGNMTGTYAFAICTIHSPDINCDGAVQGADLGLLLAAWGSAGPAGDLDRNGVVDGADLGLLLASWTG